MTCVINVKPSKCAFGLQLQILMSMNNICLTFKVAPVLSLLTKVFQNDSFKFVTVNCFELYNLLYVIPVCVHLIILSIHLYLVH